MIRIVATILLPIALPTLLYFGWLLAMRRTVALSPPDGGWGAAPWLWLAACGVVLLALVLGVSTVHYGAIQQGAYVPASLGADGRVVPGHVEPRGAAKP